MIRFNVSKDNYQNVKEFVTHDGIYFKDDSRFKISSIIILEKLGKGDIDKTRVTFYWIKMQVLNYSIIWVSCKLQGYHISSPEVVVNNNYTCYSNRKIILCLDKEELFNHIQLISVNQKIFSQH